MTTAVATASRLAAPPAVEPRNNSPLRAGAALPADVFARIRRRLVLDCCKWDPQVEDVSTLAPFPLLISRPHWRQLESWSDSLSAELLAAERELADRPDLHRQLATPRALRRALRDLSRIGATPTLLRVLRFDFHWTTDGWRISEVNADVPGGFTEAGPFTAMVAAETAENAMPTGDPSRAWADAVTSAVAPGGHVALLAAPGFMEDQQVVAFFSRLLASRGLAPHLTDPRGLTWRAGHAHLAAGPDLGPLSAVVRFYQAEWLARLPRRCRWQPLVAGGRTPVANPGTAVLTESKRLPLVWDDLRTPMPTWRRLLPETRDPRDAPWRTDHGWLIKSAYCNTGDTVAAPALVSPKAWRSARRHARFLAGRWVAQRRFHTHPLDTPIGTMFPCVGVYTINGRACGAYARLSRGPIVNYRATDVALLVEDGEGRP
jgi:glutathionylspermidine synthase